MMQAHHDGSSLHVSTLSPSLGDDVHVWLRVRGSAPAGVWARSTRDAEPWYDEAADFGVAHGWRWYRATLTLHNPVTRYRWLIETPDGYCWLTGDGLIDHDVPDDRDFTILAAAPAPAWSTDAVVYQIFPDRFARSADAASRPLPAWATPSAWDDPIEQRRPENGFQVYGGDLDGVTEHLAHLKDLGANVIYLTPFFPAGSSHRYDSTSFTSVDPLLGGDDALSRLTTAAHARGIRVMGDLTTNHSGWHHEWFDAARAASDAPERELYFLADDGTYVGWYGLASLPKLRPGAAFFNRLIDGPDAVARQWLKPPFDLDGWRIDVANMTARQKDVDANAEVARRLREAMVDERADAYLLAEHCHDASGDLREGGWHGAMNYAGFLRPVWAWLRSPDYHQGFLGVPVPVPRVAASAAAATMTAFIAATPWREMTASWSLIGSHDTPRPRTVMGPATLVAAGMLFTFPGVPMVFMGDEWGGEGIDGEDSRRPMPWDDPDGRDEGTFAWYRLLIALRHRSVALRQGGFRWVHATDEVLSYVREHADETVWCVAVRDGVHELALEPGFRPGTTSGDLQPLVGDAAVAVGNYGAVTVTVHGPGFFAWRAPGVARPD